MIEFSNYELNIIDDALDDYLRFLERDIEEAKTNILTLNRFIKEGKNELYGEPIQYRIERNERSILQNKQEFDSANKMRARIWEELGL